MLDINDIENYFILQSKYGTELESYNEELSEHFLKICMKVNSKYLKLMDEIQKTLLKSVLIQNKNAEEYQKLQELKAHFDEYLNQMNDLSKSLKFSVTPRREK